jgi:hypothetical protein
VAIDAPDVTTSTHARRARAFSRPAALVVCALYRPAPSLVGNACANMVTVVTIGRIKT